MLNVRVTGRKGMNERCLDAVHQAAVGRGKAFGMRCACPWIWARFRIAQDPMRVDHDMGDDHWVSSCELNLVSRAPGLEISQLLEERKSIPFPFLHHTTLKLVLSTNALLCLG